MFDLVKNLAHELLGTNDSGIGEIPSSVHKPVHTPDLVFLLSFLIHDLLIDHSTFAGIHSSCFVHKLPILAHNLFGLVLVPFLMPKIHAHDQQTADQLSLSLDPNDLTDADVLAAVKQISGYLDITPGDFKEVYALAYSQAHKRILSTPARKIMSSPVHFVLEDQPVLDVAKILAQVQVAGVPVVGKKDEKVAGVISEKDFMRRMAGKEESFMGLVAACMDSKGCPALKIKGQTAADIMSCPAVTVVPDTPVHAMYDLMREKNINRLPVMENERLVGIVSRDDLLGALAVVPQKK